MSQSQQVLEGFRLSPQQRWLWTLQEVDGFAGRSACLVEIEGSFDAGRLRRVLETVVERHEILHTVFRALPGLAYPLQVVATPGVGWEEVPEAADALGRVLEAPPDLEGGPVLRAVLARDDADRGLLALAAPALCCDPQGLSHLVVELAGAYASGSAEGASEGRGEELPLQYIDFAELQNEELAGEDVAEERAFWRRRVQASQSLPFERTTAGPGPFVPADVGGELPESTTRALEALGREVGVSVRVLCFACWQALLWRLGGRADGLAAIESSGRHHQELAGLPGPYARLLPVLVPVGPTDGLRLLARRVSAELEEATAGEDLFDPELSDEGPWRPGWVFRWRDPGAVATAGALRFTTVQLVRVGERFTAELTCAPGEPGLGLGLRYDPHRLGRATAERLLDEYRILVSEAVARPDRPVARLALLSAARREELDIIALGPTDGVLDAEPLHRLVLHRAERSPEAVALVFEGRHLSYRELARRASRLARRLREAGVGPGVPVGVCYDRSPELVEGILGVLLAGGFYLPLDPTYPRERLRFMTEEVRPALVLTRDAYRDLFPGLVVPLVGRPAEEGSAGGDAEPPADAGGLENLAYVLYTSGSTGRPKGVMVSHRAIANRLLWMESAVPLAADDRVVQKTPAGFDASIWEIFVPLLAGATVELARPEGSGDMEYLAEVVAERRATVLQLVPSLLRVFLATPDAARCRGLRRIFCGGEPLAADLVQRAAGLLPGTSLYNLYGPTETAIDATWHPVGRGDSDEPDGALVPIGRPLTHVAIRLQDPWGGLVAWGVPGEILVAGRGVARGYWNRPAWTAERFVPDPYAESPGSRAYRTGDLGRWREDGHLEFHGRIDRQVKLQGVRVEPAEIESVLLAHDGVGEAVVRPCAGPGGERRLVAFLTASPGGEVPEGEELRRHLEGELPPALIPAAFVGCSRLPRTASGKVDLEALSEPVEAEEGRAGPGTVPETITRELLTGLWRELLDVDRIGPRDDFFAIGGHSLLATRLVSRLRRVFGVELSMRQIFETPTVEGLAAAVELARRGESIAAPPLRPVPRDRPLPLSFAQQRLWFLDQLDPGSPAYNIPFGVRLRGGLDLSVLASALRGTVQRHESLRTTFPSEAGKPVQRVAEAARLPVPVVDLSRLRQGLRDRELRRLGRSEARWPFDLARGPLARVLVSRLSREDHVLLANLHHIVSDGWSTGVLLRELAAGYGGVVGGRKAALPELHVQYADFAVWQRSALSGDALESLVSHWRARLEGRPHSLGLPVDRPRPAVPSLRGGRWPLTLSGELVRRLAELAVHHEVTLFMAVLAGLEALLLRYTGQSDIVVGSPVAGRNLEETEPLIGFFVNTLVLRTDLAGDPSFAGLLTRVRETALEAAAHQDLPFEKLVEALQPERDIRRTPLLEVVLAFQTAASEELEMPGLSLEPMRTGTGGVKFDLVFDLRPAGRVADGLVGAIEYASDLFDEASVARLGRHLGNLLAGAAADPEQRLSELPLLDPAERHQLVRECGAPGEPPAGYSGLGRAFRDQAAATRDAVAVSAGFVHLTYGELDRRSRSLAAELRREGVGADRPVGLLAERRDSLIVGLLSVVQAGAAYLPIDPHYPPSHVRFVLEDAGVSVLLTDRDAPPVPSAVRVVPIAASGDSALAIPPVHEPPASAAAYVIYTSGSTGRQKGVPVSHANVLRLFEATRPWFGFGAGDTWCLFHSIAFDFSVWELWGALLYGGRVVIVSWETSRSPESFAELLARERVTVLNQTPSAFGQLSQADEAGAGSGLHDLRLVIFGGEALDPRSLASWIGRHGDAGPRLVNMYGITETTVHVTYRPLSAADAARGSGSPIGRPIPDLGVRLVDAGGGTVPIGVAGELLVGGAGLARGYLGRPALTAERLVPDSFGREPGRRLYRSGDLARWRHGDELEYLGRIDHQVKVRGFRIELGEVESRLLEHPRVREAVVVARDDGSGTRLVAYVTLRTGEAATVGELRSFLDSRLPRHMMPSELMALDALPLTPNGKVDRRALPEPEGLRPELDRGFVAPRDPVEKVIAGIWEEVLGLDRVGVEDDFFELGGHSLQATQVVARLRQTFRADLPLRSFFAATTVAALARLLAEGEAVSGTAEKVARVLLRVGAMSAKEVKTALSHRDQERGGSQ